MRDQIEQLYRDSFDKYVKMMSNRSGGMYNAEDIVQEAFARALLYADSYDTSQSQIQTWFDRILRRAMYDFKRDELRQGMARDLLDPEEPVEEFSGLSKATLEEVREEIGKRREDHREILSLIFIKGYRPREVVEIVDESIRNIYTIVDRFKKDILEERYAN